MEKKLTYKLNQLTTEERDELVGALGMSLSTYYHHKNNPSAWTLDELGVVKEYLEQREGKALDIFKLATEAVDA